MQKKMNYYYYNSNESKNNPENRADYQDDIKFYENPYQKYLMQKNIAKLIPQPDINSSQEEINSKEDIIQTRNEEYENMNNSGGKYRFVNPYSNLEEKLKNKDDFSSNKMNYSSRYMSSNEKSDNSKITNNICIIINKPEVDERNANKSQNIDYLNPFNNEDEENKNLNHNFDAYKKNNSYVTNSKHKKNIQIPSIDELNNYSYSYMETEPNKKGKKITLHKKLNQKKQKLKDLEKTIQNKRIAIKDKRTKVDKKENKHIRSTTFDRGNLVKGESIATDKEYYSVKKRKIPNLKNKNKNKKNNFNNNNNIENKSINSEDKIFNDIPMIKIQKNSRFDDEENAYKTMSPDISREKYNKSIEKKRKLLGIPVYKNEFQNYQNKGNKKNMDKLTIYKKRQDEILKNYEKKNIINQKSRENLKSKANNKTKNQTKISNNDKNRKNNYGRNNNLDNYINKSKNMKKSDNEIEGSNSYVIKNPDTKNSPKRNSNSQPDIANLINKEEGNNYFRNKIKVYKQKERPKENIENKNLKTKGINNKKSKDLMEIKYIPSKNENQKEKKIYENNTYYSKLINKLFNYSDNSQKNSSNNQTSKNNSDNKSFNNLSNNSKNQNKRNNNLNINNYSDVSPFTTKIIYSSPKSNEIRTIQNNEDGKTLRIIKKRHKSPKKISNPPQNNSIIKRVIRKKEKEENKVEENKNNREENKKEEKKKEIKKEYKNNITVPSRGISALRRINQKIENYKKRIPSKKKRRPKNQNQQYKSLSQLKKIGKHPFGRVKQSKSIKTLPDVNKGPYHNFDFIDDI